MLFVVCRLLLAICCSLFVVCCLLFVVCRRSCRCLVFVVVSYVLCCMSFVVGCLRFVDCCSLFGVRFSWVVVCCFLLQL